MDFEKIPEALKLLPQWVSRVKKTPVNPKTLRGAQANNPDTWGSFEQAVQCIGKESIIDKKPGICDGIGIELEAPLCGIDIDHCRNKETGELTKEAQEIIKAMDSYTEISPSGEGIHILYFNNGSTYPERRKKRALDDSGQHLEMYQTNRYFTVTGEALKGFDILGTRAEQADKIYKRYLAEKQPEKQPPKTKAAVLPSAPATLSNDEIIRKAANAKNGAQFSALYSGDTSAYSGDSSRADLALCDMLAFWTCRDADKMDSLFRQSGLMRPKWDEKRGADTYGQLTIKQAIESCIETYTPKSFDGYSLSIGSGKSLLSIPEFDYDDICRNKADDIGTAGFFSGLIKDFVCYVAEEKSFYIYNGIRWKQDVVKENLAVGRLLMTFVAKAQALIPPPPPGNPREWSPETAEKEQIDKAFRKHYKYLGQAAGRESVLKDIKKLLHVPRSRFDTQPNLLNCRNCTYNLETGEAQPHSPTDYLTKCVNADYEPTAENERFTRFIDEICEGDAQQKKALQSALGYTLIGATPEECFFIAYGKSTRNGKGTLFDLVLDTLGDYGVQMDFDTLARSSGKDASRATPDIARLVGVRYVLANEPQKGTCFNEGLVKQLTGSDNITARPLYGSPIEFKPLFTIYITSNNLPSISDDTLFKSDRIRILPFNRHFSESERDVTLKATLRSGNGKEAVLNWLIEGYRSYMESGLRETEASKNILRQYQEENDYIQQYIDERLDLGETYGKTTLTEIMRDYSDWCRDVNIRALGKKTFSEELTKHRVSITTSHHQYVVPARIKYNRTVDIY